VTNQTSALNLEFICRIYAYLNIHKDIQRLEDIHGVYILRGGEETSRNKVAVPARQATWAGGIDSLESVGFLKV
jgi:hypothetical protein